MYNRFDGLFDDNETDQWYICGKRSYMGNRSSINLTSRRGRQTVFIFTNQLKKWRSRLSEDEFAEFLTKT